MALRGCRLVHRCCRLFARHPLLRAFINVVIRIASCRRRMAVTLGFMSSRSRLRAVSLFLEGVGEGVSSFLEVNIAAESRTGELLLL